MAAWGSAACAASDVANKQLCVAWKRLRVRGAVRPRGAEVAWTGRMLRVFHPKDPLTTRVSYDEGAIFNIIRHSFIIQWNALRGHKLLSILFTFVSPVPDT